MVRASGSSAAAGFGLWRISWPFTFIDAPSVVVITRIRTSSNVWAPHVGFGPSPDPDLWGPDTTDTTDTRFDLVSVLSVVSHPEDSGIDRVGDLRAMPGRSRWWPQPVGIDERVGCIFDQRRSVQPR